MRIQLDLTACCGYGNCVFHAEDAFRLDDATGVAELLNASPDPSREQAVRDAAADCPVGAIRIVEAADAL